MKRRVLIVLLLLLLLVAGAIVNVAVAWACALWPYRGYPAVISSQIDPELDYHPVYGHANSATLLRSIGLTTRRAEYGQDEAWSWHDWSGLPFRSMTGGFVYSLRGERTMITSWRIPDRLLGQPQSPYTMVPTKVPLKPVWPGFAINTVFYASVLWLLFAAPLALRRRRRIKRGLCPKCAYDLRGSEAKVCPECGATR